MTYDEDPARTGEWPSPEDSPPRLEADALPASERGLAPGDSGKAGLRIVTQPAVLDLTDGFPLRAVSDEEVTGLLKATAERLQRNVDALRSETHEPIEPRWWNIALTSGAFAAGSLILVAFMIVRDYTVRQVISVEILVVIFVGISTACIYRARKNDARKRLYRHFAQRGSSVRLEANELLRAVASDGDEQAQLLP